MDIYLLINYTYKTNKDTILLMDGTKEEE